MFGGVLLSHPVTRAVPSALRGLASGFGMGPGVSPRYDHRNSMELSVVPLSRNDAKTLSRGARFLTVTREPHSGRVHKEIVCEVKSSAY